MKALVALTTATLIGLAGAASAHTNPTADLTQFVTQTGATQQTVEAGNKITPTYLGNAALGVTPSLVLSSLADRG